MSSIAEEFRRLVSGLGAVVIINRGVLWVQKSLREKIRMSII
jgi:hypothetical protein